MTGFVTGQRSHGFLWDRSQPLYEAMPSPTVALHESLKPFWASVSPFERTVVVRVCPTGLAGLHRAQAPLLTETRRQQHRDQPDDPAPSGSEDMAATGSVTDPR